LRTFRSRVWIDPVRKRDLKMPGKRVRIDNESWAALDLLAHDRMMTFQELADEAFADLLKKHGCPVDLRAALRRSAGVTADVILLKRGKAKPARVRARQIIGRKSKS
jgi:hypothetical protein